MVVHFFLPQSIASMIDITSYIECELWSDLVSRQCTVQYGRLQSGYSLAFKGIERADDNLRWGEVQARVGQNITFSRLPSGKWLARTRMRSDGDDLGDKGRANSPP